MKTERKGRSPFKWVMTVLVAITITLVSWGLTHKLSGQDSVPASAAPRNAVFTPAHSSVGEAVRHFFFLRSAEPEQPIAYTHKVHIEQGLSCDYCHASVATGPVASIPNVLTCMGCHEETATEHPEVVKMTELYNRGEDIPWKRVYGWTDEAHVRFNHAPHIKAEVGCETCHGDVAQMTVARRVVDHTMGFCVNCHEQRKASNDCMTCHY